jgi:hypothetical protein
MMSMLATGWLPWGIDWRKDEGPPRLSLCDDEYIMCCGHTWKKKQAQVYVDEGLVARGPTDRFGRECLVITDAGHTWLQQNWPS